MDKLQNFGFLIKDIGRLYTKLFEQKASHLDVTLAQCKVLVYIHKNEGVNQVRLAELCGIEPMSLVRILDRMEGDHWIERRAHPSDRRARLLYLTDKAQPTLQQLWKISDAVRAQTFIGFKAEERSLLVDLLERAHVNLLDSKADEGVDKPSTLQPAARKVSATHKLRMTRRAEPGNPAKATLKKTTLKKLSRNAR